MIYVPSGPPFRRWLGPYSPARGTTRGFRVCGGQLGVWVVGSGGSVFWTFASSPGATALTSQVLANWHGGRVLLLPNGLVIKPLQEEDEAGKRVLIGRFSGAVVVVDPSGTPFDFSATAGLVPGQPWPGPDSTGLECIIESDGSLKCAWYHPAVWGRQFVCEYLLGPTPGLAAGFRKARPGVTAGRVRVTANGAVTTNRQERDGTWVCVYVGMIACNAWPHRTGWLELQMPGDPPDTGSAEGIPAGATRDADRPGAAAPGETTRDVAPVRRDVPLYRGPWPEDIDSVAKYVVRRLPSGEWGIAVAYENRAEGGSSCVPVESAGASDLIERINKLRERLGCSPGGTFYVNEFRHVLVRAKNPWHTGSVHVYYCAGVLGDDLVLGINGQRRSTKPVDERGNPLRIGADWVGPWPGIPYMLAAEGRDIYYEMPQLTWDDPPRLLRTRERVHLGEIHGAAAVGALSPIAQMCQNRGGRVYVNEHGAVFRPRLFGGDGDGLHHVYCGQVDFETWFPEPAVPVPIAPDAKDTKECGGECK